VESNEPVPILIHASQSCSNMKIEITVMLALVAVLAQASPAAEPNAQPLAALGPEPASFNEAANLFQKRDKWCKVSTNGVKCRKGAGTGYGIVRQIDTSQQFGVSCKANGESIGGTK
jgi:hypothetical protein